MKPQYPIDFFKDVNLSQVARESGISRRTLMRMRKGQVTPTAGTLMLFKLWLAAQLEK